MNSESLSLVLKIAYCLYRVSTKKQVDKTVDDIPVQRKACHEFAEKNGWVIGKEFCEKGVSGFKVSANDRDAVQDLREAAMNHEFDILLVFMFDRIGRIDSETPFVVEWFVNQGIEVWSVKEGQQKIESHTDKLINYMRYWQANGESLKTSMRVKTVMDQMTAEGIYRGGVTPFGYRTVEKGRLNKKGQPLKDLEPDPVESELVKTIFNKTVFEGYGSYRMAEYVNALGVRTHNGSTFQCTTIIRILKNRVYCGYYVSGNVVSPKIDELVIIDENIFDMAQEILKQRAKKNDDKVHIARTTKGRTLLSGNLVCGHCGSRMMSTGYTDKYIRKDGTRGQTDGLRYMCYHRARKLNDCDGQSVYSARRIDEDVIELVEGYLERIKSHPKEKALEMRYRKELDQKRRLHEELIRNKENFEKRLKELSMEVGKSLTGESKFSVDVLSASIDSTRKEISSMEEQLKQCETELNHKKDLLQKLDYYYQQFVSWAYEFKNATLESKKMIICYLIDEIRVSRGYKLEISFNVSYEQFFTD